MPHSKHHPGILLEAVSKTKKNVSGQPEYWWIKYQNTPYTTNISACFIVHSLHYMFRPWSVMFIRTGSH
jgi:hypothetical protein